MGRRCVEPTTQPNLEPVEYRPGTQQDVEGIAALHADNWRRHYRGAYSNEYLDGDVFHERRNVWTARLGNRSRDSSTVVAEFEGHIVGFVHVEFNDDSKWGALVDNLHVAYGYQRQGIGARLMSIAAEFVTNRGTSAGLHLWVLERNHSAQAFYRSLGGESVERKPVPAPGGVPERLIGTPYGLRFVWPDPMVLVNGGRSERSSRSLPDVILDGVAQEPSTCI